MGLKRFYSVQTDVLAANPPSARYLATVCPGNLAFSLVVVEHWDTHEAQDAWEDLPSVNEHYPENMGVTAPAGVIAAIAPWGAQPGMTLRQVFRCIRQNWAVWRH